MPHPRFGRARAHKFANGRTTGFYSTAVVTFADIDSALLSVTLDAQAGDVLEADLLSASFYTSVNPSDVILQYTFGGVVPVETGSAAPIHWTMTSTSILLPSANLRFMGTVTTAMIVNNAVVVRPQWATGSTSMVANLKADTSRTPRLFVRNLGPVDPN